MRLLSGLRFMSPAPTPVYVMVQFRGASTVDDGSTVTVSSRYIDRARPMTSNPGPVRE